jgi:hypothetical protein
MVTVETTFTKEELLRDLSPNSPFVLFGVSWDDYEEIVRELDGSSVQMTYNDGILKIMAKSPQHEYFIETIKRIVDRDFTPAGFTFRQSDYQAIFCQKRSRTRRLFLCQHRRFD